MVNITIDGRALSVPENTTILEAARLTGIEIPTLCYLKDLNEIGACRVCVVEVEGSDRLVSSCNAAVAEGMVIHTNSPKVRRVRRRDGLTAQEAEARIDSQIPLPEKRKRAMHAISTMGARADTRRRVRRLLRDLKRRIHLV